MSVDKEKSLSVLVSGGGTGGHIYPALAIIESLKKLVKSNGVKLNLMYIGTDTGLEAKIVPKAEIPFRTLRIRGFKRSWTISNFVVLWLAVRGLFDSVKIIREFKPDVAVGTGGFVCGPIMLVASLMGVPAVIQEQNALPGFTNKILSLFVDKVSLGYEMAKKFFPSLVQSKLLVTGNPVRTDFFCCDRETVRTKMGVMADDFVLVVAGGSRGARSINRAMLAVHRYFAGMEKVRVIHVTGKGDYDKTVKYFEEQAFYPARYSNVSILSYVDNMPEILRAADLAVFRAGAVGLAELSVCGVPSILIPYPYAAENHQEYNAKELEKLGAALVLKDSMLGNGDALLQKIIFLWQDKLTLENMIKVSKKMGDSNAGAHIAKMVYSLLNKKRD